MYGQDGKEISRTEVTSVEKKSLDANLFVVPADYARQDMSAMANRMKAAREQMRQTRGQGGAKAEEGRPLTGGPKPDMSEMMKQFGEMMKKKQQSGQ
jgi:Domain of unknown function (DUF4412)